MIPQKINTIVTRSAAVKKAAAAAGAKQDMIMVKAEHVSRNPGGHPKSMTVDVAGAGTFMKAPPMVIKRGAI